MKSKKPFIKHNKQPELKYYGYHACLGLWKSRPQDVIRVYVEQRLVKDVSPLLKWCASHSKAYHIVSPEEMCKVADSVHHEGLCILAKELPLMPFSELLKKMQTSKDPACVLYLDGVQNPHNIGSIMRVCAHFGIKYILGEKKSLPNVSPSAYRVSQGGAEHVQLVVLDNTVQCFDKLGKAGFQIVATSSHGGHSLYHHKFTPRTIVVMGSESEGVKKSMLTAAKETILIPGTGWVESLNVSVATGLILGEYWRQQGTKS